MLFNSIEFAFFLPIVFIIYWFIVNKNLRLQNFYIVLISYIFYGWWDWRFLFLISLTSLASYLSGIWIFKKQQLNQKRNYAKWIMIANVILNLSVLGVFKYFDFFGENLYRLFKLFGFNADWPTLNILLPVGISFYTFQAVGYTIDVYKKKINPAGDIVSFFAYISFFPQLVAGPIERATQLLPQFYVKREFDYSEAVIGMRQILWGLFKKIVVADNCAIAANAVFDNYADASGSTLVFGAIMFTFQIYGDFSGYSDIAIGVAKLFGINLMQNFNYPYFSRDIAEFWRRWHISLTKWFRDYVYIPLGGSRGSKWKVFRNTMVIFLISGFWHGANWTFIVWGLYNALLFLPLMLTGNNRKYTDNIVAENRKLPTLGEIFKIAVTFTLVAIGLTIFRSESITDFWQYACGVFDKSLFSMPVSTWRKFPLIAIALLLITEWLGRRQKFPLEKIPVNNRVLRWSGYIAFLAILFYMYGGQEAFIYFQF